jgi:hypothetical protein
VLVTEVEDTQTRAIFVGALSVEVVVSLNAVVEYKYSSTVLLLKR